MIEDETGEERMGEVEAGQHQTQSQLTLEKCEEVDKLEQFWAPYTAVSSGKVYQFSGWSCRSNELLLYR